MGGCRCSFRTCAVTTQRFPQMHFFHYPLKDKQRLEKWLQYANYAEFLDLTLSQAKNKSVCALHFRDECFMNYKKTRLTPTAIPTLDRLLGGKVLDYESNDLKPIVLPPVTDKHLIPPPDYLPLGITEDAFKTITTVFEETNRRILNEPIAKRPKIARILNQDIFRRSGSSTDEEFEIEENVDPFQPDDEEDIVEIGAEANKHPQKHPTPYQNFKMHINDANECELFEESAAATVTTTNILNIDEIEFLTEDPKDESANELYTKASYEETCNAYNIEISDLKSQMDRKVNEANNKIAALECELADATSKIQIAEDEFQKAEAVIEELNAKLKATEDTNEKLLRKLAESPLPVPKTTTAPSSGPATKAQLFNGIKKYLTASMTALVRMEMFGSSERAWKPDEKQVAVELLHLGENVYKYFNDEWRFRLPPAKQVQTWAEDVPPEDEDDL